MSLEILFDQQDTAWHEYSAAHNEAIARANQLFRKLEAMKAESTQTMVKMRRQEEPDRQETLTAHIERLVDEKVPLQEALAAFKKEYVSVVRENRTTVEAAELLSVCRRTVERTTKGER